MAPKQQAEAETYGSAWAALVQFVRDGHSWSGNERNRLFLNRGGTFSDVSAVSNLDHDGDGRALAVVDWDRDGDLDLCYRNRTAPRIQLMLNNHVGRGEQGARDSLTVKLEGTSGNRDAIGAVVEVLAAGQEGERLVKSVRAGDLFLSQSSRWLHFGLGAPAEIREIRVLWPGQMGWESFAGARAGGRYLLVEGSGTAAPDDSGRPSASGLEPSAGASSTATSPQSLPSVLLPARIPLPPLGYRNAAGQPQLLAGGSEGQPRLVVLWSASCERCRRELASLGQAADQLRDAGLQVTALSVDSGMGNDGRSQAYDLVDTLKWPSAWGFIELDALARLDEFQRALFDLSVPLAVPLSFLCDRAGNVSAIYRSHSPVEALLRDHEATRIANNEKLHALAPPFAGRWFTKPVDPVFAAEFMARQFETRLPEDALFYLAAAHERATDNRKTALARELAARHHSYARSYKEARRPELAAAHFESALAYTPSAALYLDYGTMTASYGNLREAQQLLEQALVLEPNLRPAREALALVNKLIAEGQ